MRDVTDSEEATQVKTHLGKVVDTIWRRHLIGVGKDNDIRSTMQHNINTQKQTPIAFLPTNTSMYLRSVCNNSRQQVKVYMQESLTIV